MVPYECLPSLFESKMNRCRYKIQKAFLLAICGVRPGFLKRVTQATQSQFQTFFFRVFRTNKTFDFFFWDQEREPSLRVENIDRLNCTTVPVRHILIKVAYLPKSEESQPHNSITSLDIRPNEETAAAF